MASLQQLPPPLLRLILSYADAETICNAAITCKDFRVASQDPTIWERLHRQRWKVAPSRSLTRANYEQRHRLDASTLKCIDSLQSSNNHLVMLYAVTHIMSSGNKVLDSCWKVWQNDHEDKETRETASSLVHLLHCLSVCDSLMERLANSNKETNNDHQDPGGEHFEECMILTSKMFFHLDKDNLCDTESECIRAQLDDIAKRIQDQFYSRHLHLEDKLSLVHKVFFRELLFSVNDNDFYDCDNSLLHVSLKRRQANPMTMAILYKCICCRVGINVDIIGLPGENFVRIPDLNRFVDLSDAGRVLSLHDCEVRFSAHRFPLMPPSLEPRSTEFVVQHVLKHIDACLDHSPDEPPKTGEVMKRAVVTALRALACSPDMERMESCRRLLGLTWVAEFAGTKIVTEEDTGVVDDE